MNTQHIRRLAFAGAASLALVVAACGSDSKASSSDTAAANTATSAAAGGQLPGSVTIGYQYVPNGDLIVKHRQLLEKAFGPDVKVGWKLFNSGGDVNEAVAAGAVDIGLVGSSPTSRGVASGIPYEVPWIFDVIGNAEALVVKGDKGINSIADLKGKTIATPFASTSHFSLLAALDDAGVAESDVKIIDSDPDAILAAWTAGQIDGAYVWNPNLAKLEEDGGKVLITSADLAKKGKTTYDLAIVTTKFASAYPGAVQTWLDQQNAAVNLIKSDPDAAAADIAAELNITPAEAKSQLGDLVFVDAATQAGSDYLGGGLADNLYASAQFNKGLGKIDSVPAQDVFTKAVVATYAAGAS